LDTIRVGGRVRGWLRAHRDLVISIDVRLFGIFLLSDLVLRDSSVVDWLRFKAF
jgi:hypothetical protein